MSDRQANGVLIRRIINKVISGDYTIEFSGPVMGHAEAIVYSKWFRYSSSELRDIVLIIRYKQDEMCYHDGVFTVWGRPTAVDFKTQRSILNQLGEIEVMMKLTQDV